ncbi:MAG: hypothetical protein J0L73_21375 [Verrucomicrobia bacterium]|nr:hypothetical protein [Verrucomicrobiota bacterium]
MRMLISFLFLLVTTLPAQQPAAVERKLESLLLMPEPKAMRGAYSITLPNSQQTVFTCYRESTAAVSGVEPYSVEAFTKLGLSVESFAARAKAAADKRILQIRPELIRGDDGRIAYAVYRGDSPLYAALLIAPSLPKIFTELFGPEIWVATPDRHSLYVFPAKPELLNDFAADLAERYASDAFAASCEIFSLKAGAEPRVVASFAGQE